MGGGGVVGKDCGFYTAGSRFPQGLR